MELVKKSNESSAARQAYNVYEAMGAGRNLSKLVFALYGYTPQDTNYQARYNTCKRWQTTHSWLERVREYDDEQTRQTREQYEADLAEMNERHLQIAKKAQVLAIQQIQTLMEESKFTAPAAVALLKLGIDLERMQLPQVQQGQEITVTHGQPITIRFFDYRATIAEIARGSTEDSESIG